MRFTTRSLLPVLALVLSGCGVTELEEADLAALESGISCATGSGAVAVDHALDRASLVVVARPGVSYFVDGCHRAFVLEVESVWKGTLAEPVLAIIEVDPVRVTRWADLDRGDSALFVLEPDPEVPEAYRPVGEAGGLLDLGSELAEQVRVRVEQGG